MVRYNLVVLTVMVLCSSAFGGALTRSAGIGPSNVGNGSDPDGPWISENLAFKLQIPEDSLEVGMEVMVPKFKLTFPSGRTLESKNMIHPLPWLDYVHRLDDDTVIGLNISTQNGIGASFEKPMFGKDSSTLLCGTYAKLYIAQELSDEVSMAVAAIGVQSMLKWHGPLDIGRRYLPVNTDTRADGFGLGYQIDFRWQPRENLAFGLSYMSSVKCDLEGRTEILSPFQARDRISTEFRFPDQLALSAAWKPSDDWLVVTGVNYHGYSDSSSDSVDIKFDKWLFTKPVQLNWRDIMTAYLGVSHSMGHWTIGGGVAYMSQSVPDETVDFMTPDVTGYSVAGRIGYHGKSVDLTASYSHGWGSSMADAVKVEATVHTIALAGTIRF